MFTGTGLAPRRATTMSADPFRLMRNRLARVFEEPFLTMAPSFIEEALPLTAWVPPCDIVENDKEVLIKMELPEIKKENVNVSFENGILTIRGERKLEEETKKENYHRIERSYGEFLRSFTLPPFVDNTNILAEFKEGMLLVHLPKLEEKKPKQIEIKVK